MRLVTYVLAHDEPLQRVGVLLRSGGLVANLGLLVDAAGVAIPTASMLELLGAGPRVLEQAGRLVDALERELADGAGADHPAVASLDGVRLLAPIPRPGKLLCVGVNYRDHVLEVPKRSLPDEPFVFSKLPSVVIGPYDSIRHPGAPHTLDYEVELALVIGRSGRRIPPERALEHVAPTRS